MSLTREQRSIARQIAAAWVTIAMITWPAVHFIHPSPFNTSLDAWAFSALLSISWLFIAVGVRAKERYLNPQEIGGSAPSAGSRAEIDARVLQNTLEQTILMLTLTAILCQLRPLHWYALLIAITFFFNVGRACFWWGYHRSVILRGYGFALGFHALIMLFVFLVTQALSA